jgi:hypothetical protein
MKKCPITWQELLQKKARGLVSQWNLEYSGYKRLEELLLTEDGLYKITDPDGRIGFVRIDKDGSLTLFI